MRKGLGLIFHSGVYCHGAGKVDMSAYTVLSVC